MGVPFLLWRQPLLRWLQFATILLALYLPFWLQGNRADGEGILIMGSLWEFNSLGFALLSLISGPILARSFALILTGAGVIIVWEYWRRNRINDKLAWQAVLGWFLFWSPVINPWYLLWLLPWAAIRPSWTVWLAFPTVLLSYATAWNLGEKNTALFAHPVWVRPVEAVLIALGLAMDLKLVSWIKRKAWPRYSG